MELAPIKIAGQPPASNAVLAQVWPQNDPPPEVGAERTFLFDDTPVRLQITAIMDLGEGLTGVMLKPANN